MRGDCNPDISLVQGSSAVVADTVGAFQILDPAGSENAAEKWHFGAWETCSLEGLDQELFRIAAKTVYPVPNSFVGPDTFGPRGSALVALTPGSRLLAFVAAVHEP